MNYSENQNMKEKRTLIIGTRQSELALWQSNFVKNEIEKFNKNIKVELELVQTKGDKILDVPLAKIGDKGLFTKELEHKLLDGSIDLAVHSLKDMETTFPPGLILAAVPRRHDARDALIGREKDMTIEKLPDGAVAATSSLRRASQLQHIRPDIRIVDLRGNVPTRIRKFLASDWDAILLACAGLERLKLEEHISSYIDFDILLPAAGQGALGLQAMADNKFAVGAAAHLHDENTFLAVTAERTLLRTLEGGCQVPVGAYAEVKQNGLSLDAIVGSLDGSVTFRKKVRGRKGDAAQIGENLANDLLEAGAREVLNEIRDGI